LLKKRSITNPRRKHQQHFFARTRGTLYNILIVQPRGEEIAERTEEETEIEDEGILDLDLVRLLRRLVLDLGLALARESGTAEEVSW